MDVAFLVIPAHVYLKKKKVNPNFIKKKESKKRMKRSSQDRN